MRIEEDTVLSFDDVLLKPQKCTSDSRSDLDISTTIGGLRLEIPIIAANMPSICGVDMVVSMARMGGLGIIHRMQSIEDQLEMVDSARASIYIQEGFDRPVGASIGIGKKWQFAAQELIERGCVSVICIDVAHGHQERVLEIVTKFKKEWPNVPLIVGNIATAAAARDLTEAGANSLKIGVGSGSVCSTRIKTGCGIPTFQSVIDVQRELCSWTEAPDIVSDGGIKNSGDIVKSLAAGANAVMLGSLLAGTDEAPGEVIKGIDGNKYKVYRGAASYGAKKEFFGKTEYIEGEETLVPYRGSVQKIVHKLCEGIRSGFSYSGAANILDLQKNAVFIKITNAGMKESRAHGLL